MNKNIHNIEDSFKLPDNYFENFASQIDAKIATISENEQRQQRTKRLNRILIPTISIAATIAILLTTTLFINTQNNTTDTQNITASTTDNTISNDEYIEMMFDELDTDIIEEIIAEADYNY